MSEYGQRLEFNKEGLATCSESGQRYKLENNLVSRIA
jgi:UDP-2-acetamido-3-amino-2,3-dideoxy-glucuronate N-acetyltransferase